MAVAVSSVSGLTLPAVTVAVSVSVPALAGPEKVLFGTDGPWLHPGVELAKVRALGLPPSAERLIVAGNWLRLTAQARARWPRRPGSRARIRFTVPRSADGHPPPDRADPWAPQPRAATGPT